MERTHKVSIYLSPDELQQLRMVAASNAKSMSDFARSVLMTAIEKQQRNQSTKTNESEQTQ